MGIAGAIVLIKNKREALGYSQEYVANLLGISQPAYNQIESGATRLSLERAVELTKILQIPLSELEAVISAGVNVQNNEFKDNSSVFQQNYQSPEYVEHLMKEIEYLRDILSKTLEK